MPAIKNASLKDSIEITAHGEKGGNHVKLIEYRLSANILNVNLFFLNKHQCIKQCWSHPNWPEIRHFQKKKKIYILKHIFSPIIFSLVRTTIQNRPNEAYIQYQFRNTRSQRVIPPSSREGSSPKIGARGALQRFHGGRRWRARAQRSSGEMAAETVSSAGSW